MTEVETALESHELLKIKLPAGGRAEKKTGSTVHL